MKVKTVSFKLTISQRIHKFLFGHYKTNAKQNKIITDLIRESEDNNGVNNETIIYFADFANRRKR